MRKFEEKIGSVVIPTVATNIVLWNAIFGRFIKKITPMADLICPVNLNSVEIVDLTREDYALTIDSLDKKWKPEKLTAEQLCGLSLATTLASMNEKIVEFKTSAWGTSLVGTHEHFI